LFANNPFPGHAPRYIRAVLYRYEFAPPGSPGGRWWNRHPIGLWLSPISEDNKDLRRYLRGMGWIK
jgi:hypothetical protein